MQIKTLKKRRDFLALSNKGDKIFNADFIFIAIKRLDQNDDNYIRAGLTVSKKVGNAPARNRVKRRLRAAIKTVLKDKLILPHDIVLIARKSLINRDFSKILENLNSCIIKLGLLKS